MRFFTAGLNLAVSGRLLIIAVIAAMLIGWIAYLLFAVWVLHRFKKPRHLKFLPGLARAYWRSCWPWRRRPTKPPKATKGQRGKAGKHKKGKHKP